MQTRAGMKALHAILLLMMLASPSVGDVRRVGLRPLAVTVQGPQDIYRDALPSIMTVTTERADGSTSTGTAFLVIRDGIAATAYHVVRDAQSVSVRFSDDERYDSSGIIDYDEFRDVALIRVKVAGRPLLALGDQVPEVGARAYVIGAPLGLEFSLSEGLVSQVQSFEGRRLIQFTCSASPGNSGGPLLDSRGMVVGVVSAQMKSGQNLNFAVPAVAVLGLDASLATRPWGGSGRKGVEGGRVEVASAILDRRLGRSFNALFDLDVAISLVEKNVAEVSGGYANGIPAVLYRCHADANALLDTLQTSRSSDPARDQVVKFLVHALEARIDASNMMSESIRKAQAGSGWTVDAKDTYQRAQALIMGYPRLDPSAWEGVANSDAFRAVVERTPLVVMGVYPDTMHFKLGVRTWANNSLFIAYVVPHGLADDLGIVAGDMITQVNEQPVKDLMDLKAIIRQLVGQSCSITVRRDGKTKRLYAVRIPKDLIEE